MNADDTEQAWWDADLQGQCADEELFWDELKGWLGDSRSFHDWLLTELNQRERSIWHVDDI